MTTISHMPRTWGLYGVLALAILTLPGCRPGEVGPQVAGWALVDTTERHPIIVSQQPASMSVRVPRGTEGLSPRQRAEVLDFVRRYRAADSGDSRILISAPSGSANEVDAMQAVHEIRDLLTHSGFSESVVAVEAYHAERKGTPPVRISYMRYIAEGPQCGSWPTNLAREPDNLPYENLGCATQRNLASMVANPADLLGPQTETARASERRDVAYGKYVKGQPSGATRSSDERVNTSR